MSNATAVGPEVSNGAEETLSLSHPYIADIVVVGSADILFHRWCSESVEAKSKAAKGSKAKKQDDVQSYVYRNDDNEICLPGEYVRQAIIHAAKFRQDPRSPRKSAMDLYKAGVVALTALAPLGAEKWDYEHRCRVCVQRAGVTRSRPAMKAGWKAQLQMMVLLPEYIRPDDLNDVLVNAGRLIGVGDFRPTYGRFNVTKFETSEP